MSTPFKPVQFCKVIEHKGWQILITKEYDDESDSPYQLSFTTEDERSVRTKMSMGYKNENKMEEQFNSIGELQLDVFLNCIPK